MKILLMGFTRIAHMPYMQDYASLLCPDHEVHLVSWNRSGVEDSPAPSGIVKSFVFRDGVKDEEPLKNKLPHFANYRRFVIGIMKRERYDKIAVLHSTPGITVMDYLLAHYKGSYLLDYRDVSHESLGLYRRLIRRLSLGAGLVVASSPAYFKYLENANGVILKHNLLIESPAKFPRRGKKPIRVRYWGMIRHERANLALIDELGGDNRFELHYNGREEAVAAALKRHVSLHGYSNVFFHGAYYPYERSAFAVDTDIIHNVYENDFATIGAMGNKYYDGIQFHIPQICSSGSIMGELVSSKQIGLAIDYDKPGFGQEIIDYLNSLDYPAFDGACERELAAIQVENDKAMESISRFFS